MWWHSVNNFFGTAKGSAETCICCLHWPNLANDSCTNGSKSPKSEWILADLLVKYESELNFLQAWEVPRHFVYRHFVHRHFVYYFIHCIPGYMTVTDPTSVSANHYFHLFQLLLTL